MEPGLFIFHRDLRLTDNTALRDAMEAGPLLAGFIFDHTDEKLSRPGLQFLFESLLELEKQIERRGGKLGVFEGRQNTVIAELLRSRRISRVYLNHALTAEQPQIEQTLHNTCRRAGADLSITPDATLFPPEALLKANGEPYSMFTPFYQNGLRLEPEKPRPLPAGRFLRWTGGVNLGELRSKWLRRTPPSNKGLQGGRTRAEEKLRTLKHFAGYNASHDFPAVPSTRISPHLAFGTCSAREVFWVLQKNFGRGHGLIRALYWREFFYHLAAHFPHVFKQAFKPPYDSVAWSYDRKNFKRWCDGCTGFPLVDAGMRELNETGFMHNRVRLVTASFLTKDLLIDWRWGEDYFAKRLIDYDPAVNNGNWQWTASTGADAQPFFRVFNPWRQQRRFDPDCAYIKKWVPELRALHAKTIHALEHGNPPKGYPPPMADHGLQASKAVRMFEEVRDTKFTKNTKYTK